VGHALAKRRLHFSALSIPRICRRRSHGLSAPSADPRRTGGHLAARANGDEILRGTEPSTFYNSAANPWHKPIIPVEMISVLMQYTAKDDDFRVRGPAVGLFADQEIRLINGPVFVGETYDIDREVVALSGSRRTESVSVRSTLYTSGTDRKVATMLLNLASMKESYAAYAGEHAALYGA
jgi:hypothetical protein